MLYPTCIVIHLGQHLRHNILERHYNNTAHFVDIFDCREGLMPYKDALQSV